VTSSAGETDALVNRAVARARGGDAAALHFLFARYVDDVHYCVQSFIADPDEAEAVTRTVFAKLRAAIAGYDEHDTPFSNWLLRVARDAALDHPPRSNGLTA